MNKVPKRALKLIGTRVLFVVLSVFFIMPFSWLIEFDNGFLYYSILVSIFYLSYVYSDMHVEGGRDKRQKCVGAMNGLLPGILSEIPGLIMILILLFVKDSAHFRNANIVFLAWSAPFIGFLGLPMGGIISMTSITPYYYLALLPVPIISALGYFAGVKGIYLLARYKCNIKKKDDKKAQQ